MSSELGSYWFQMPPSPRKGGMPLSAEVPAPVKPTMFFALERISAACLIFSSLFITVVL